MADLPSKYFYKTNILNTNKGLEFEVFEKENSEDKRIKRWNISFLRKRKMDHAGFDIELETPHKSYRFSFYDLRHWNKEENRFHEKGESIIDYLKNTSNVEHKEKYLDSWLDRHDLRDELENEFGSRSLHEALNRSEKTNPLVEVYERLFPKID